MLSSVSTIGSELDVKLGATLLAGALVGIHNKQCKVAESRKKRKVASVVEGTEQGTWPFTY
jgi:hypothetical protein